MVMEEVIGLWKLSMASLKNISFGESGCFDKLVSGHFGL